MNALGLLVLLVVIAIPVGWVLSEFQDRRYLRLTLGSAAILSGFVIAFFAATLLQVFHDNVYFGVATKKLVGTTITQLEAGNQDRVLSSLKRLQQKYSPTYENKAGYDALVEETVAEMQASPKGTP
jgi:hypothetical protein